MSFLLILKNSIRYVSVRVSFSNIITDMVRARIKADLCLNIVTAHEIRCRFSALMITADIHAKRRKNQGNDVTIHIVK